MYGFTNWQLDFITVRIRGIPAVKSRFMDGRGKMMYSIKDTLSSIDVGMYKWIPTCPHFLTMSIWLCSSLSVPSPVTSSITFTTLLHAILFISVCFDSYFYLLADSDQSLTFDMTFGKKKKKSQTYCSFIILSESKIQPQVINRFIFLWVLTWSFPKNHHENDVKGIIYSGCCPYIERYNRIKFESAFFV